MDIDDLRKEFLYSRTNQIGVFRRDRISVNFVDETIGSIDEGGRLILPEWSFELGNLIDITKVDGNIDGYCLYNTNSTTKCVNSYVQILRNGIIEDVEVYDSGY